jgi:HD-GYP domain-containing protein (c-di-GMP phosphodiesterase class II)
MSTVAGGGRGPGPAPKSNRLAEKRVSEVAVLLHGAARAVRLYPAENAAVRKVLAELGGACDRVEEADKQFEVKRAGDYLFINDTRLRLGFDNLTAVNAVIALMRDHAVGTIGLRARPSHRDWVVLLGALGQSAGNVPEPDRLARVVGRLDEAGVLAFALGPTNEGLDEVETEVDGKERSRQTYMRTVTVTRDIFQSARVGGTVGVRRARRVLRGVVDQVLKDEASILGLTTLRDFDEYTFVHSVNVCILSVALGRRLGLSKPQLLELGLAALMHDVGKARIPLDVLNKPGALTEEEFALVREHTWRGVLALFGMPFGAIRPWRAMIVAFEHHLRMDGAGYPRTRRARNLSLFSRIVAVVDGFDAATSKRVYQNIPWSPADVLRGMRDTMRHGLDPVIVKAFISMIGVYPLGTVVVLDTGEVGVVVGVPTDPSAFERPVLRLVVAADGSRIVDDTPVDLALPPDDGRAPRTIIRTEDPERYGIVVTDYTA